MGQKKMSLLVRSPHFRGWKRVGKGVIFSEVSSFQRLKCMQGWYLGWEKVSWEVSSVQECPYRGVQLSIIHTHEERIFQKCKPYNIIIRTSWVNSDDAWGFTQALKCRLPLYNLQRSVASEDTHMRIRGVCGTYVLRILYFTDLKKSVSRVESQVGSIRKNHV